MKRWWLGGIAVVALAAVVGVVAYAAGSSSADGGDAEDTAVTEAQYDRLVDACAADELGSASGCLRFVDAVVEVVEANGCGSDAVADFLAAFASEMGGGITGEGDAYERARNAVADGPHAACFGD